MNVWNKIYLLIAFFTLSVCECFTFFIICNKIIERSFHEKQFKKIVKQVAEIEQNCYKIETRENKDPQTILVSTWYPKLNTIPSIFKNNFHFISNKLKLSKTFKQKSTVAYRKTKLLSTYLMKNDIGNQQLHSHESACGKYKPWPQIKTEISITNDKLDITEKIKRH